MKVGILTWWHNSNYGGFLQGLATQEYLRRIGVDAELVDYSFPRLDRSPLFLFCGTYVRRLRHLLLRPAQAFISVFVDGGIFARMRRLRKTHALFAEIAPRVSPRRFRSLAEIGESRRYQAVLVGSDQTWNPHFYEGDFSYLLRDLDARIRKVSYAASVAAPTVHPFEDVYREGLSRFDAISVREKAALPELERLSGRKIAWVVDPTLLLSADEWRRLLNLEASARERHVCVYWLSPLDGRLGDFMRLARRFKCKVRVYTDLQAFRAGLCPGRWPRHLLARLRLALSRTMTLRLGADAREFLQDLSTAEAVFSDSFHALMFSMVFDRKVAIAIPPSRAFMSSRIVDFAERVGVQDLLLPGRGFADPAAPPASSRAALRSWIAESKAFLQKVTS